MKEIPFFKVVCESVDVFEKSILVDKNCQNLDEVHDVMVTHPELMEQNYTWILYPMFVKI